MKNNFIKYKNVRSQLILGNKKNVFLSIVIPTYNREELLIECLNSIVKQKLDFDYEIVLVDNNNDFNNKKLKLILQDKKYQNLNILYYKNEVNIGQIGNWNRCIELANGEWITMIHDDDFFNEGAIEKILDCIEKYSDIAAFYFDYTIKNEVNNKVNYNKVKSTIFLLPEMFIFKVIVAAPIGLTFKKSIFIDVGGFSEEYYPSSDWEIILRILEKSRILLINDMNIATYRISVNDSLKQEVKLGFIIKDYEITKKLLRKYPIKNFLFNSLIKRRFVKNIKDRVDGKGIKIKYSLKDKINYFIINKIFNLKKYIEKYYFILAERKAKQYMKKKEE